MTPCTLKLDSLVRQWDRYYGMTCIPDHLVCNGTHLVGEAVLVSAIRFCCDRDRARVLTNVLSKDFAIGVRQLVASIIRKWVPGVKG